MRAPGGIAQVHRAATQIVGAGSGQDAGLDRRVPRVGVELAHGCGGGETAIQG